MNRSLAPWRPARMSGKSIMGLKPYTCFAIAGVGSAATSTLVIEAWQRYRPAQGPVVPALVGWIPWGIAAAVVGIVYHDAGKALGVGLASLGGSLVAIVTNAILG